MDANLLAELLPAQFQGQLTPLAGGLTNHSWRLDAPQQSYWLRMGNTHSESLGINRGQELVAHQAAADADLAPLIHYAKPELGILLLDWLPESDWELLVGESHQDCAPNLALLMGKVAQLHQLTPVLNALSLNEQAEHYLRQLSPLSAEHQHYARCFEQANLNLDYSPVFCHHDLNAANVLGARPWLIDWEYAAFGDAAFELAVIADSFKLSEQGVRQLLADYNAAGGEVSYARFQARRPWVQWLTLLWAALQYQYTGQSDYRLLQEQATRQLAHDLADFQAR
ncbi:choline/ethanolamine kinase family protein [Oceanisphaera sp. IT1-181]|uniref:choline/ethanolamine kinase family protein n=1 Tax=Oceanisphaera sp. IT1-181 TaxID=3081199 RepID=UPI0029CA5512|nr:phosphotransferase [Oceanisphaera sp. IT1-181]